MTEILAVLPPGARLQIDIATRVALHALDIPELLLGARQFLSRIRLPLDQDLARLVCVLQRLHVAVAIVRIVHPGSRH